MERKERIVARADQALKRGMAGDWIRLRILAGEIKTLRERAAE